MGHLIIASFALVALAMAELCFLIAMLVIGINNDSSTPDLLLLVMCAVVGVVILGASLQLAFSTWSDRKMAHARHPIQAEIRNGGC